MNRFDRKLWRRYCAIAQPFFYPIESKSTSTFLGLLFLLLAFLLAITFLSITVVTLGSQFVFPQYFNQLAPGLLDYIDRIIHSPQSLIVILMFCCPLMAAFHYKNQLLSRWKTWGLLSGLLLLAISVGVLNVTISYVMKFFTTALSSRNPSEFWQFIWVYCGVLLLGVPIVAIYWYSQDRLGNSWRKWLTEQFLEKYFKHRSYYQVEAQYKIDNPDQRIAEDIKSLTVTSLKLLITILEAIIDLILFGGILWSISTKVSINLFLYAFAGTVIVIFLGKRLISLNFDQLKHEADFRHGLINVRDNRESIAFYQGEYQEKSNINHYFSQAFNNFNLLIGWQRNVNYFTTGYRYLVRILPYIILAPIYFSGDIQYGDIVQANFAFRRVLDAFSVVVDQIQPLGELGAGVNRLASFSEALEQSNSNSPTGERKIDVVVSSQLSFEHLTLLTPDSQQVLIEDLSLRIPHNQGLLIVGESGVGKSSLLRMIAGLWMTGTGRLVRPKLEEMLFLPQRPYMISGSLREQLLYPHLERSIEDNQLLQVLQWVNLEDLPQRVGGFEYPLDWGNILSLGEQQRLAFARVLLSQPKYAILDEATSALDLKNEARLYAKLQETYTTYISVGHRPSLLRYHQQVLELTGNAQWSLTSAKDYKANLYKLA
ncbi:MAG: ABC transporter ATP-binding protein/permease [Microcoleaceae cyanobacterium]